MSVKLDHVPKSVPETLNNLRKILGKDESHDQTFSDYIDTMRKAGFSDDEKWKKMIDRAKKIASDQGSTDKFTVLGILQSFFKEK